MQEPDTCYFVVIIPECLLVADFSNLTGILMQEDRENILRARSSGKGVLTSPFKLLKSNHLGVVLTFAVYNSDLPPDATPEQRTEATVGFVSLKDYLFS